MLIISGRSININSIIHFIIRSSSIYPFIDTERDVFFFVLPVFLVVDERDRRDRKRTEETEERERDLRDVWLDCVGECEGR